MHNNNNSNSLHNNQLHANQPQHNRPTLLQDASFVRLPTILKLFPISKSTWWLGIRTGRFPKGIKISSNITAWRVEDISRLISNGMSYSAAESFDSNTDTFATNIK